MGITSFDFVFDIRAMSKSSRSKVEGKVNSNFMFYTVIDDGISTLYHFFTIPICCPLGSLSNLGTIYSCSIHAEIKLIHSEVLEVLVYI